MRKLSTETDAQGCLEATMARKVESNLHIPAKITKIYGELDVSAAGLLKNFALNLIYSGPDVNTLITGRTKTADC
jgi:hypothetical protein